jgi:hypothetical protein
LRFQNIPNTKGQVRYVRKLILDQPVVLCSAFSSFQTSQVCLFKLSDQPSVPFQAFRPAKCAFSSFHTSHICGDCFKSDDMKKISVLIPSAGLYTGPTCLVKRLFFLGTKFSSLGNQKENESFGNTRFSSCKFNKKKD